MTTRTMELLVRCVGAGLFLSCLAPMAAPQEAHAKDQPAEAQPDAARAAPTGVPEDMQTTSLLGEPLGIPPMAPEALARAEVALTKARQVYADRPHDPDSIVWLGRRFSGVGKYKEAVALYDVGLKQFPDDAHLLRHRGHRYITLRQFDLAVADLSRAEELVDGQPDEPEPPLVPNDRGIVLDTFHENIHYHLALAHYLRAEWEAALAEWQATGKCVTNDDGRVMVAHWTWLTLQRLGRPDEAAAAIASITPEMDIVDYQAYHQAVLVYRGLLDPDTALDGRSPTGDTSVDFASLGYGVARWQMVQGRVERGEELLKLVSGAEMWAAFGRIAAEADLARQAHPVDAADADMPAR